MADDFKLELPVVRNGKVMPKTQAAPDKEDFKLELPKAEDTPAQKIRTGMNKFQPNLEMMRGATFGLSDRALALIGPGKYEENLKEIQQERDDYRKTQGLQATLMNLGGGVATGGAVSNGLRSLGAAIAPKVAAYAGSTGIGPLLTRLGMTGTEGAAIGEAAHQGEQGYGNVGHNLGSGAAMGAGLGMGLQGAGKVVGVAGRTLGAVGQHMAMAAGAVKPETFANKNFIQSLKDHNLSPEEIQNTLKYLRGDDIQLQGPVKEGAAPLRNNEPPIVVADALPKGTLGMIKKAAGKSDTAGSKITEAMLNRSDEQGMRLKNSFTNAISDDVDSTAAQEALKAQRKAAADPLYKQAYAAGTVDTPMLDQWLAKRPVSGKIFHELQQNMESNGEKMQAKMVVNADGTFGWKKKPTVEDLDTLKKHLDEKINKLWNPAKEQFDLPSNVKDSTATQLMDQRNDLIDVINKVTPDGKGGSYYAQARKSFADDTDLIQAHHEGRTIINERPEDVKLKFDELDSPELRDQYRAGVTAAVKDQLDKASTDGGKAIVRRLYGSPGIQSKLNYIMANDSTREAFNRSMAAEKAMVNTQKDMVPRSSGGDMLSGADDFSLPLAGLHAISGRFGSAFNQLGRLGSNSVGRMAPEVGDHLADIAMMTPEEFAIWQKTLAAQQNTFGAKTGRALGGLAQYIGQGIPVAGSEQGGQMVDSFRSDDDQDQQ